MRASEYGFKFGIGQADEWRSAALGLPDFLDRPHPHQEPPSRLRVRLAPQSKCLARSNKSRTEGEATNKRNHSASASIRWGSTYEAHSHASPQPERPVLRLSWLVDRPSLQLQTIGPTTMRKLLAATAVLAALTGNAASADVYTGNKLVNDCARGGSLGFCQGYILGVSYSVTCVPKGRDGVTADQLRFVVVQYIGGQPARWHNSAASLIVDALKNAYGC